MIFIFKCPSCGDQMHFSIEKQMLICDTCSTEISINDYDSKNLEYEGTIKKSDFEEELEEFHCINCNSVIMMQPQHATAKCAYCGSILAAFGSETDTLMPEKILPFKINKDQARSEFSKWWLSHKTLPTFNQAKMKLEIEGMYIPVWLSDVETTASMEAIIDVSKPNMSNIYAEAAIKKYYPTISQRYSRVNTNSKEHQYVTSKFHSTRQIKTNFKMLPTCASMHFSATRFNGIEPYEYIDIVDFTPAYLSGLKAERYELTPDEIHNKVLVKAKQYAYEQCLTHIKGAVAGDVTVRSELSKEATAFQSAIYYALVPVWICSYMYGGKRHVVYVNGQDGKTDGEVLNVGTGFTNDLIAYGASTFALLFSLALFLVVKFASQNLIALFTGLFGSSIAELLGPIIYKNWKKNNSWAEVKIDLKRGSYIKTNIFLKLFFSAFFLAIGLKLYSIKRSFSPKYANLLSNNFFDCLIFSALGAIIFTWLFSKKHAKKAANRDVAEYNDYIPTSSSKILASRDERLF